MHALFDDGQTLPTYRRLAHVYPRVLQELGYEGQANGAALAYLITGPRGVGARTAAYAAALHILLKGDGVDHLALTPHNPRLHTTISALRNAVHPECHNLPASTCTIDNVRTLCAKLALRPRHDCTRVVVIEKANLLSPACANGLLKTLEHPGPNTIFLITADGPVALTLASRCRRLVMPGLSKTELVRALTDIPQLQPHLKDPFFLDLAQGRIGRALTLAQHLDWAKEAWRMLQASLSSYPRIDPEWASAFDHDIDQAKAASNTLGFAHLWYEVVTLFLHHLAQEDQGLAKHRRFAHIDRMLSSTARLFQDYLTLHTDILLTVQAVHATIYATWGGRQ